MAGKRESVTVAAEDALIAALKVKYQRPDAVINYVRRCNERFDQRIHTGRLPPRPSDRWALY